LKIFGGELVDEKGNTRPAQLRLTIKELWANESKMPVSRAVARVELIPDLDTQDGNFTLRYTFDGKQDESRVRVSSGHEPDPRPQKSGARFPQPLQLIATAYLNLHSNVANNN
jgi:hypothetical protein